MRKLSAAIFSLALLTTSIAMSQSPGDLRQPQLQTAANTRLVYGTVVSPQNASITRSFPTFHKKLQTPL